MKISSFRTKFCLALLFGIVLAADPVASQQGDLQRKGAKFSALDKITAETTSFTVQIDETVQFGALLIKPRSCFVRPRVEQQQTSAYVEIEQITLKRRVRPLFRGWLFAEAPSLSLVQHPIYDVWLVGCTDK